MGRYIQTEKIIFLANMGENSEAVKEVKTSFYENRKVHGSDDNAYDHGILYRGKSPIAVIGPSGGGTTRTLASIDKQAWICPVCAGSLTEENDQCYCGMNAIESHYGL